MKAPVLALLAVCALVMLLASPSPSTAVPISVLVDGSAITENCGSDTESLFILSDCPGTGAGRTYGTFIIKSRNGTSPAKVVATDNAGDEEIKLENVLIEPNGTQPANCDATNSTYVNCTDIVFSKVFNAGPSATGSISVTYFRKAKGSLESTAGGGATLSTFRVHGWVEDADVGVENPIGSAQAKKATSTSYVFADSGGPLPLFAQSLVFLPTSLSHERELKGQFWFGLKQTTHRLKLEWIKVYEPTGSGGDEDILGQTVANDPSVVGEDGSRGGSGCVPCCRMCPRKPHPSRDFFSDDADTKLKKDAQQQKN